MQLIATMIDKKRSHKKRNYDGIVSFIKNNIPNIVGITVMTFLLTISTVHLLRGGIHLIYENQTDAVSMSGYVEDIDEIAPVVGSKYDAEQNNGRGVSIVVDGVKYHLMEYGDLEIGDYVVFDVLPKSKFILKLEKQN